MDGLESGTGQIAPFAGQIEKTSEAGLNDEKNKTPEVAG